MLVTVEVSPNDRGLMKEENRLHFVSQHERMFHSLEKLFDFNFILSCEVFFLEQRIFFEVFVAL